MALPPKRRAGSTPPGSGDGGNGKNGGKNNAGNRGKGNRDTTGRSRAKINKIDKEDKGHSTRADKRALDIGAAGRKEVSTRVRRKAVPAEETIPDRLTPPTSPEVQRGYRSVYVLSRSALRQIDRLAVEHFGLPTLVLMENAAAQLAGAVLDVIDPANPWAMIVCGKGNNGGDGLALARHLHNAGVRVGVLLAAPIDEYEGDPAIHLGVARRMGVRVAVANPADPRESFEFLRRDLGAGLEGSKRGVIVDALLGTGLDRAIEPASIMAALIGAINAVKATGPAANRPIVLAVDVPSGLDADTGRGLAPAPNDAVRADITVTFIGLKLGYASREAQAYLGEVMVADIGCPMELVRKLGRAMDARELKRRGGDRGGGGTGDGAGKNADKPRTV